MFSIVIATYNGEKTLPLTLSALANIQIPEEGFEVIAIDNGSTDNTRKALRTWSKNLPLKIISESRRGKAFAINTGIEASSGKFLVFLDDDVLPEKDWLIQLAEYAGANESVAVFAGQVRHFWEKEPPDWLQQLAIEGRAFGGTKKSRRQGPMALGDIGDVKGANFMIRSRVAKFIGFCEEGAKNFTGEAGSAGGEDTEFVRQAIISGERVDFVAGACVRHIVRPEEVRIGALVRRYVRLGRAAAVRQGSASFGGAVTAFGYPRYLAKTLIRKLGKVVWNLAIGRRYDAANEILDVAVIWGKARQFKNDVVDKK